MGSDLRDRIADLITDRDTECVLGAITAEGMADAIMEIIPQPEPDPWGPVIDQVVGLAAVYDIVHEGPTTPEQVTDLWSQVIYAIALESRSKGRMDHARDHRAEVAALTESADNWHLLTDALVDDLRMAGPDDDQSVDRYRTAVGRALWRAFGIGRRWQAAGTGAKFDPLEVGSPFNLKEETDG